MVFDCKAAFTNLIAVQYEHRDGCLYKQYSDKCTWHDWIYLFLINDVAMTSAVVESTQPESESKTMTFESESKSESLASESRVRVRVPRSESRVRVRVLYEIWPYRLVWWISPILIILLLLYTQDLVHVRSRLILSVFTLKFHVKNSSINAFWKY